MLKFKAPREMHLLRSRADEAAALMRTLGNPDRLLLLCELSQGELGVSDLAERTGIVQPSLSQQLTVLRAEELVAARRDGKRMYYSVADPRALTLLKTLYKLFCGKD